MADIIQMPSRASAIAKLDKELKEFKGGNYEKAVSNEVCAILKHFCEQEEMFAMVVNGTKRTLSDVCYEIMKEASQKHMNHVSDIDVYRWAVKNYFPNSEINFKMVLELGEMPLCSEVERETVREVPKAKAPKSIPKPVEPPRELTVEEKIQLKIEEQARKEQAKKEAQEKKIKEQLEKEKKRNDEMGQLFLFDL